MTEKNKTETDENVKSSKKPVSKKTTLVDNNGEEFLNSFNIAIDIIAAGIEADTVMPANSPKYVFAAERMIDNIIPSIIVLKVNSVFLYMFDTPEKCTKPVREGKNLFSPARA